MATIKRRSDRGNRWEVRYRDPDGKQRARLFDRKVDAEQFAAGTTVSIARGTYVDPRAGRVTFGEYAEQWRMVQVHRASTAAQVETNLRLHVLPFSGHRPIGAVRPTEVQGWVREQADTLGASTVETVYRYVVAIFRRRWQTES